MLELEKAASSGPWSMVTALCAIGTLLTAITATSFALRSLRTARVTLLSDHDRRRGEATMDAVRRFIDKGAALLPIIRNQARDAGQPVKAFLRNTKGTAARVAHQELLQEVELLALGCRLDVYSTQVVYDAARTIMRQTWQMSSAYVQDVRTGDFDSRPASPSAYEHFEWLIHRFDQIEGREPGCPQGALKTLPE